MVSRVLTTASEHVGIRCSTDQILSHDGSGRKIDMLQIAKSNASRLRLCRSLPAMIRIRRLLTAAAVSLFAPTSVSADLPLDSWQSRRDRRFSDRKHCSIHKAGLQYPDTSPPCNSASEGSLHRD